MTTGPLVVDHTAALAVGRVGAPPTQTVPGEEPGDIITDGSPTHDQPGFSYNNRESGSHPGACVGGLPAPGSALPYCTNNQHYLSVFTIDSLVLASNSATMIITVDNAAYAGVQFSMPDFVHPGVETAYFTPDSHGWLFGANLTNGIADGRGTDFVTCLFAVPCEVDFRFSDYYAGNAVGDKFVDVPMWTRSATSPFYYGIGDAFIPMNPTSQPPPPPPTASFTVTSDPAGPLAWDFDASASKPGAGATIAGYSWDFGDHSSANGTTVTHTYAGPGTYQVTLTVTDSGGQRATATHEVKIAGELVVNSAGDRPDRHPADDICDTGGQVSGKPECTLRAAITTADARAGKDTITFDIPGSGVPMITLTSALPDVTDPATLDGTSQPGGFVELRGPGASGTTDGLVITGGHSDVSGFVLGGLRNAIVLRGGAGSAVTGNRIGVAATGDTSLSDFARRTTVGVLVEGSTGNAIGGDGTGAGNLITGADRGVDIKDSAANTVAGNVVGVSAGATASGGNGVGVLLEAGAHGNVVGPGNVAQGNQFDVVAHQAPGNRVTRDHLGVGAADQALPRAVTHGDVGLSLTSSPSSRVDGNTIADHGNADVYVDDSSGSTITGNGMGVSVRGSAIPGKGASNNSGLIVSGSRDVTVSGNVIAAHRWVDLLISGVAAPRLDLRVVGHRVAVTEPTGPVTGVGDVVSGNLIGLLADGTSPIPVAEEGVILTAHANSAAIDPGNAVAGHPGIELEIIDSDAVAVNGSRFGLGRDGRSSHGSVEGIVVRGSTNTDIGGAHGNVVGQNTDTGILVTGGRTPETSSPAATHTSIANNRIGVSAASSAAAPNGTGIAVLPGADSTTIRSDVIAGNTRVGVASFGTGTTLSANKIGLTPVPVPNGSGVAILAGTATLTSNAIAFNGGAGVSVAAGAVATLTGNPITHNAGGGISETTPPVSPAAIGMADRRGTGGATTTQLLVPGLSPGQTVEIFGNADCRDPEGAVPLYRATVRAGRSWVVTTVTGRPDLTGFTATTTDAAGHTSEFSDCVPAGRAADSDGDGVPDAIEALAGNGGDANGDGTPDSRQSDVATLLDATGDPVTLVAGPGLTLTGVRLANPPVALPAGVSLPAGAFSFTLGGVSKGGRATVSLELPTDAIGTAYYKFGPATAGATPSWYEFSSEGGTGATRISHGWQLTFVDGQVGDSDGVENGRITDPGGPGAVAGSPASSSPAPTGPAGSSSVPASTGVPAATLLAIATLLLLTGALLCGSGRRVAPVDQD